MSQEETSALATGCEPSRLPAQTFRWRDRKGVHHIPSDMATSHLFFTLRMIWNHSMPLRMHVGGPGINRYTFGPAYTVDYMADAVKALAKELDTRSDLAPHLKAQLDEMKSWYASNLLPKEVRDGT